MLRLALSLGRIEAHQISSSLDTPPDHDLLHVEVLRDHLVPTWACKHLLLRDHVGIAVQQVRHVEEDRLLQPLRSIASYICCSFSPEHDGRCTFPIHMSGTFLLIFYLQVSGSDRPPSHKIRRFCSSPITGEAEIHPTGPELRPRWILPITWLTIGLVFMAPNGA